MSSPVRYVHIRPGVRYDADTKTLQGQPESKGGVTIAFKTDPTGTFLDIAIARCHERDAYSRSKGRLIAGGRLEKGLAQLLIDRDPSKGLVEQVVEDVGIFLECLSQFTSSHQEAA